jgi:hypothetical protein
MPRVNSRCPPDTRVICKPRYIFASASGIFIIDTRMRRHTSGYRPQQFCIFSYHPKQLIPTLRQSMDDWRLGVHRVEYTKIFGDMRAYSWSDRSD